MSVLNNATLCKEMNKKKETCFLFKLHLNFVLTPLAYFEPQILLYFSKNNLISFCLIK